MSVKPDRGPTGALDHAMAPIMPVVVTLMALACLAAFARAAAIAWLQVPLDPNEGWNAYHAAAATAGHGLYPGASGFMTNNYPPLSFYIVGFAGLLVGDDILAGRIVSLLSILAIVGCMALAIRRMDSAWLPALFGALLLAGIWLITSDYVGMDDPQLLGHALQLAALVLLLQESRRSGTVIASAVLFVAGGFVKHNLFALPAATAIWLALIDRRSALRFALWGIALSLAGLFTFRLIYGFDLLARLDSARAYSLGQLRDNLFAWLAIGAVPLGAVVGLFFWSKGDRFAVLVAIFTAIALLGGAILLGGAGVDVNAMFDADIALALGTGVALDRLAKQRNPLPHFAGRALALAAVLPLALLALASSDWRDTAFWLHPMRDEAQLARTDISFLRAHPGPVLCESLAFCYWAGKPAEVDVFNLDQELVTHARDPAPFLRFLAQRHFAAIELDETSPFPFPPAVQAVMLRNYRVDHSDDEGVFLVPR